jgi:hypothetical protein
MQHKLALKHLSGSRANTIDTLALPPEREITFGRDSDCHVRYAETDDLVSRKHLKIVATDEQPVRYMVVDLGSRNGTFVNRQRVFGAVCLMPGGRVQLGADGPAFEFQALATDIERASSRGRQSKRKRRYIIGVFLIFLLLAASAAGYVAWPQVSPLWQEWRHAQAARQVTNKFTPSAALASVASVEAEWNIFDRQTGTRLARAYIANERVSHAARIPLIEGAPATLPVFVLGPDRKIEPLLIPAGTPPAGSAIAGKWRSKGVIVSESGAVLTAAPRHSPWSIATHWKAEEPAGALLVLASTRITQVVPLAATQFPRWTPAESGFFAEELPADLDGDIRGRRLSRKDIRIAITADIAISAKSVKAKLTAESSGIWLASIQSDASLAGVRVPPLSDAAPHSKLGQRAWVVSDEVEAAEIQNARVEGLLELRTSRCAEGGVVFDHDGRVLALCIPEANSQAGTGIAIPIRHGLALLGGAANDNR